MPFEHIRIQMIPYRASWNCEVGINFQKGCKNLMKCYTLTSFLCAATHMNTRTHRSLHFCNWLLCGWIILQPSIVLVNLQPTVGHLFLFLMQLEACILRLFGPHFVRVIPRIAVETTEPTSHYWSWPWLTSHLHPQVKLSSGKRAGRAFNLHTSGFEPRIFLQLPINFYNVIRYNAQNLTRLPPPYPLFINNLYIYTGVYHCRIGERNVGVAQPNTLLARVIMISEVLYVCMCSACFKQVWGFLH
jgi:hypothetical protein